MGIDIKTEATVLYHCSTRDLRSTRIRPLCLVQHRGEVNAVTCVSCGVEWSDSVHSVVVWSRALEIGDTAVRLETECV